MNCSAKPAHFLWLLLATLFLAGCDVSMTQQKKARALSPSAFWHDGASARPLPPGTVAQGDLARDAAATDPPTVSLAVVAKGRERYDIFCAPCHGLAGEGDGIIVARGFPAPQSFALARLRAAPAQHFFDAITNGYGTMYPFGARIPPQDRWAIIAYVRALQLASAAQLASVPEAAEKIR
ncbi:MAG: cytochrome c [Hyphomicrobiales bacterium]|nr:cytochrome c [Hyphomicrobiales bacterium]